MGEGATNGESEGSLDGNGVGIDGSVVGATHSFANGSHRTLRLPTKEKIPSQLLFLA